MSEEFYIGWQDRAPARIGATVRRRTLWLVALVASLGAVIAATQPRSAASRFEFGTVRSFEGAIELAPYPMLVVERPGGGASRWLLTVFGKRGAEEEVGHLDGHRVRLEGTLIYRDRVTMVEIADGGIEDLGPTAPGRRPRGDDEQVTLRGEIVDSKCYLGVMKPGNLKTHRACAVRCISGGVPPVLLVRDDEGRAAYFLLTDEEGRAVGARVLHLVAQPVEVTGRVVDLGDGVPWLLKADPDAIERSDDVTNSGSGLGRFFR